MYGLLEDDEKKKKALIEKLEKEFQSKDELEFEKDFFSFTVMCYLKDNKERYMVTP